MADNTNNKKNKKDNKSWLKDLKVELKKVTWLTPRELTKNTATVIAMVLVVALLVFILDFVFDGINNKGVGVLKTMVNNTQTVQTTNDSNNISSETANEESDNTSEENTTPVEDQTSENSNNETNQDQ